MTFIKPIKPQSDLYIEGYRDFTTFCENFGITRSGLDKWRQSGKALMIYTKQPSKSRRGRKRSRIYVDAYEVMRYLHIRGRVDLYELVWKGLKTYAKFDFFLTLCKLSQSCKEEIFSQLKDKIVSIVEQNGNRDDKRLAVGLKNLDSSDINEQIKKNKGRPKSGDEGETTKGGLG